MNVCGGCGLEFSSVKAFDAHRVGRHAYTFAEGMKVDAPVEDGRRCLDLDELETLTDKDGGVLFALDAHGRWGLVKHRESARMAFLANPVSAGAAS